MKSKEMETGVVNPMKSEISHDNPMLLNIVPNSTEEEDELKDYKEIPEQVYLKGWNFCTPSMMTVGIYIYLYK
jgi:hypothetical protein